MNTFLAKYKDIILLISSIIGLFLPLGLYLTGGGFQESVSAYYYTNAEWVLFGSLSFMSTGFLIGSSRWKLSGILLLLIAIVNVEYQWPHNIIAAIFFIHVTRVIAVSKRFSIYAFPIILSVFMWIIGVINLYEFEIISIMSIIAFNITYLVKKIHYMKFIKK